MTAVEFFSNIGRWLDRFILTLANRPSWRRDTLLLAVGLSLFLSFPRPELLFSVGACKEADAFMLKAAHPFTQHEYPAWSHESKLTFRLVPPLIGHVTGFGPGGMKIVEALAGFWVLWASLLLAEKLTRDRRLAILATIVVASVFAGTTGFVEYRFTYDSLAIALLLSAALATNHFLIFLFLSLGAWTDERVLVAAGLVWCFHAIPELGTWRGLFSFHRRLTPWMIYLALLGYWGGRFLLSRQFGLTGEWSGIGIKTILKQSNNIPLGLWSAFEGGWILVGCATVALVLQKKWIASAAWLCSLCAILYAGLAVMDITRSLAYGIGAFFIALRVLRDCDDDADLLRYLQWAALICILWPSVYACDRNEAWWHSPPMLFRAVALVQDFLVH